MFELQGSLELPASDHDFVYECDMFGLVEPSGKSFYVVKQPGNTLGMC